MDGSDLILFGGTPRTVVKDSFTETIDTDLGSHAPEVQPAGWNWVMVSDDVTLPTGTVMGATDNCRITDNGNGVTRGARGNAGRSDGKITMEFTGNATNPAWMGILFRETGASVNDIQGWHLRQRDDTNTVELIRPDGSLAWNPALASSPGDKISFRVDLRGSTIKARVVNETTGVQVETTLTGETANQANTYHGITTRTVFGSGVDDRADNWKMVA